MTVEDFEKIRQISKEDYEKWKKEQIKLELQSPKYIDARIPNEIKDSDEFLNLIKEKLKDYNDGFSQECEGTFKIKDGEVTDINITGIALIPRFGDNGDRRRDCKIKQTY